MLSYHVKRVAICEDCIDIVFEKKPKPITRAIAICNGCGREHDCLIFRTNHLPLRKEVTRLR